MRAGSIAETGARPGQWVKCVKMLETGHPDRFRVGKSYPVVDILGKPRCYGELVDAVNAGGGQGHRNPHPSILAGIRVSVGDRP